MSRRGGRPDTVLAHLELDSGVVEIAAVGHRSTPSGDRPTTLARPIPRRGYGNFPSVIHCLKVSIAVCCH